MEYISLVNCLFILGGLGYLFSKRSSWWGLFLIQFILLLGFELGAFMLNKPFVKSSLFWINWLFFFLLILSSFWIFFTLIFSRKNFVFFLKKGRMYLGFLFLLDIIFLFFLFKARLLRPVSFFFPPEREFILTNSGKFFLSFIIFKLTLVLFNLEGTIRSLKPLERRKVLPVWAGLVLIIFSYLSLLSLAIVFSFIKSKFIFFSSFLTFLSLILIFTSLFRYGFVNIAVSVKRQIFYTSMSLTLVGLYLLFVALISKVFFRFGWSLHTYFSFLGAFLTFGFFLLLVSSPMIKERVVNFIDENFYKDRYNWRREWASFSERLAAIVNLHELTLEIKKAIQEVVRVKNVELIYSQNHSGSLKRLNPGEKLVRWVALGYKPVFVQDLAQRAPKLYEANRKLLEELGAFILIPLGVKDNILGLLSVGEKIDSQRFSLQDLELLEIVARQSSIALLNAHLSSELAISQQLEEFHKLSSFLIHDLKNFVSTLSLIVQNYNKNIDNPDFQKDTLEAITITINKMQSLTEKLTSLPERLEINLKRVDINQLLEELMGELKLNLNSGVRVEMKSGDIPWIWADTYYLRKVFINIILNAIEAMPQGGVLTILTRYLKTGEEVEVLIQDSGLGMSEEFIQEKLFKPFKSNKRNGLGIGLYQSRTIIEAHKGRIEVKSQKNKGTSFYLYLPLGRKRDVLASVS